MGKNFAHSGRALLAGVMIPALMLGTCPVQAQVPAALQTQATMALPEIGYGADEACSVGMSNALSSAGQYSAYQTALVTQGYLRQPPSFFSCLQPILSAAQGLMNMFNGTGGFNIGSLLTTLAKLAVGAMIQQLATQACASLSSLMSGFPGMGSIPSWQIANGQVLSISGSTQGTSVTNMIGNAPSVIDPGPQGSQMQTGSMVMAQQTLGSSIQAVNTPTVTTTDSKRFGPHTPSNAAQMTSTPTLSLADADTDSPGTLPSNSPTPPALPTSTLPSPAAGTSEPGGGTLIKNYQSVIASGMGVYYGLTQMCASIIQSGTGPGERPALGSMGSSSSWHPGPKVQGLTTLAPGTVIMTFLGPGNSYNAPVTYLNGVKVYHQHTAIYLSQDGSGIYDIQQYTGKAMHKHLLPWTHANKDSMEGQNYYVSLH